MKWFKHMSDASSDEFLAQLEDQNGLEAIARWWKMLEAIAIQMDKTDRCYAEYPIKKWMTILSCKQQKILDSFVKVLQNFGKISANYSENILKIECPKLLEFRDEYSRKSGATPDKVAPDTEVRSKKEDVSLTLKNSDLFSEGGTPREKGTNPRAVGTNPRAKGTNPRAQELFDQFVDVYPKKRFGSKEKAREAFERAIRNGADPIDIVAGARRYAASDEVKRGFAKGATAWLNDNRWEFEYDAPGGGGSDRFSIAGLDEDALTAHL